jgi:glyoxylase-like metal-dependent hydrolase (beta-lactamase superfamily II)
MGSISEAQSEPQDVTQKAITQFQRKSLQTNNLGDGVYLFSGDGANVVAVAAPASTLLIDSGMASRTTELNSAVFSATHRPVTRLVDTNWHFDHTGGNMFFGTSGASIIAQSHTKTRLSSTQNVRFINLQDGPYPPQALPTITFDHDLELTQGTQHLRLLEIASAHTDGDTVVFIEPANIVVFSDIFSQPFYPVIDVNSGGTLQGIIDSIDQVLSATNEQTKYVPGHGPIATRADLEAYRKMLVTSEERISTMVKAGKTMDQVVAEAPVKDFDAKWGTGYVTGDVFTKMVYSSVSGK